MRTALLLLMVVAALGTSDAAALAAPANDDVANATVLSGVPPATFSFSTVGATVESGEPYVPIGGSVWFRWTATHTGGTRFGACGADVSLEYFTGSSLATLGSGSQGGGDSTCTGGLTIPAHAGSTYLIQATDLHLPAGKTGTLTSKQVTAAPDVQLGGVTSATAGSGRFAIGETTGAKSWITTTCVVTGPAGGSVQCYKDTAGVWWAAFAGLADGPHTLTVGVKDDYGNVDPSPAQAQWVVDATSPETTILGGAPDPLAASVSIPWGASEAGSTFECAYDTPTFTACAPPLTVTPAIGNHLLRVRAVDAVGNVDQTPASLSWTRQKPSVTVAPTVVPNTTPPAVTPVPPVVASPPEHGSQPPCAARLRGPGQLRVSVLRRTGVRVTVSAPPGCPFAVRLARGTKTLASRRGSADPHGRATVLLRPARRSGLAVRAGARLTVTLTTGGTGSVRVRVVT